MGDTNIPAKKKKHRKSCVKLCTVTPLYIESALLSGGNDIIVIGGDNKYEDNDEKERGVISL